MHSFMYYVGATVVVLGGIASFLFVCALCVDLAARKYTSTKEVFNYLRNRNIYNKHAAKFRKMRKYIQEDYYSLQGTKDLKPINAARELLDLPIITQEQLDKIDDWGEFDMLYSEDSARSRKILKTNTDSYKEHL